MPTLEPNDERLTLLVAGMAAVLDRPVAEVQSVDRLRDLGVDSMALVLLGDYAEARGLILSDELLKTAGSVSELAAGAEWAHAVRT